MLRLIDALARWFPPKRHIVPIGPNQIICKLHKVHNQPVAGVDIGPATKNRMNRTRSECSMTRGWLRNRLSRSERSSRRVSEPES